MGEKTKKPVVLTGVDTKMVSAAGFEPASPRSARIISPDHRHDSTAELRRQKKAQIILFQYHLGAKAKNGGRTQNRTGDTGIFSPLLYRLSYPATLC